jgi:hypothetical protein
MKEILKGRARRPAPTSLKIPGNCKILTGFVEATRQLSVVAPTLTKKRIAVFDTKIQSGIITRWIYRKRIVGKYNDD